MWKRRPALMLLTIVALAGCVPGDRPSEEGPVVPLSGLDPVQLVRGQETPGDEEFSLVHGGFRYLFSSEENRARFVERPERYAIRFDGQCARMQGGIPGNPDLYTVYRGRIYIFGSRGCREAFRLDPESFIEAELESSSATPLPARRNLPLTFEPPAASSRTGASDYAPDDWPQWGGLHRDFKSPARGLAAAWPEGGPVRLWQRGLGDGFSSIAVERGKLYTMYRRGGQEVVVSIEGSTGKTLWEYAYDAPFTGDYRMEYGPGPHATPLVAGGLVFAAGATAILNAVDKNTGRLVWRRDLVDEFDGTVLARGYASSPLAYGDTVIVTVGGSNAAIVAFDRTDGSLVWRSQDFRNSPSSPILVDVDGEIQLVAFMYDAIVGVDPETGRLLWHLEDDSGGGHNMATPVWGEDNRLFVSSAYGGGSRLVRLERRGTETRAEALWFTRKMRIHFGNAIRLGDYVFGSSGDFGPSYFAAIDVNTGELIWRERGLAKASFIFADGRFVILDEDGTLALATPTATGLTIHSRVDLLSHVAWTVPALSGTTLYVRDRKSLIALDLG